MDSQIAIELQQIKAINQQILVELQQNKIQINALNCTDGEKSYSPGMKITNLNQKYRCENVNGHGEWKEIGAFQ
ncbi:TPA: hypothetical protein MG739_25155 [Klebsiella pneumoniae]|uniref:Uncharacterized protein n=1 Tax=Klebsiella pneumoniae TaxID=573 RepID=A0A3G4RJ91_KLEPN|nr:MULTISPECIES: hypothetical protein [Klebsiella]AYU65713.1 hypothetical protein [Klebsiella pneumoniae]MBC4425512.1 hypothetical protein [Klebsiella variicola]MBK2797288.1 hypothetical protein [Klebsiella pneumoniae]MCC4959756.1 hypothetical protein [Klebsiella pneumoniae]MCD7089499.1 hypothetical protein [Klebsiella quasipneumoniae subsp. quasipneumoniae]